MRHVPVCAVALAAVAVACSNAGRGGEADIRPTYDKSTGRLTELTYDSNHNGHPDTWTEMDGARPVRNRIDENEDGTIDQWEYYDGQGKLVKVAFSRANNGKADAWAFPGEDGRVHRIEISSTGDENEIDRWEHYDDSGLVSAEEDTNADGVVDRWETYRNGVLVAVSFDETGDGRVDRRLTYEDGALVAIETDPDPAGNLTKRRAVK